MHKLMLIFRNPPDILDFETRWSNEFVPKAERMPGIRRVTVSRIRGGPGGTVEPFLIHEFYFKDAVALQEAISSPQGEAAGNALMGFAAQEVTVCFAEHLEEERTPEGRRGSRYADNG